MASNLPCLNEEQQIITNPSLHEDETEETPTQVEREKRVLQEEEEIGLENFAKHKREPKIQDLPPKPRPKSTPVTIHSTAETKQQRINAVLDLDSGEKPKYIPNPELLEIGKIRSKSLDIDGRVPRSLDSGLSPVRKVTVPYKASRDDRETRSKSPSGRKSPEIYNAGSDRTESGIGRSYLLDFKKFNSDAERIKFSRSCEKDLNVVSDSQKRPLSLTIGDKPLRPIKSPLRSDLELRFRQNPDNEEKVPTPIRSPVKSIDLSSWSIKSPIHTPSFESKPLKPLSPTRGSNLDLKLISSTAEPAEEIKPTKSRTPLRPLKSPVYGADSSISFQTQNVELSSPKGRRTSNDMEKETQEVSELQESVQKLGKNSDQYKSLQERRLESSDNSIIVHAPLKHKENDQVKTLQLPTPNNEVKDEEKSPKKIFANLELSNLTTKPFRSFSDPKSPRTTLRSTNLSPRSPNISPRSPILPPKPVRSPVGIRDAKSPPKGFEIPKVRSKCDNISDSSENLFSKSPPSPLVSPKTFTMASKPLRSPTEDKDPHEVCTSTRKPLKERSQVTAPKSPSSDNLCFSDVTQKPLKKVSVEEVSEQKMANRSPLTSPKSGDATENPFLKPVNFETKPEKSSDSIKELPSKAVKTANSDDVITVKKSFDKPNLCPKPLKTNLEASNSGPKLSSANPNPNPNINKSCNKTNDNEIEIEERRSRVGKNREIFQAFGNKESNVSVTHKMATGSSKVSAFVNKTESFKSTATSNTDEKPNMSDKQNIGSGSETTNKRKTSDPNPRMATGSSKVSTFVNKAESFKTTASSYMDEKPNMPDKQNIGSSSVTTNIRKMSDSFKSADMPSISTRTTPKATNAFKSDDVSDSNGKSRTSLGGPKSGESNKTVSSFEKPKSTFTSKPSFSSKTATETPKAAENSTTSSRKDPEQNLPSTLRIADSSKSDSSKAIATPKKPDSSKNPKKTSLDEASSKMTVADGPAKVTPDPEKPKPLELTSAASTENIATGIDVSQNNTNRLSALFEARKVDHPGTTRDPPGTTVKIEVISKEDNDGQKPVKLREKGKSTEKISELSSRQSKVLDLVKNFQKLQAT